LTKTETVNANSRSEDLTERILSNFSRHPFNLFGFEIASVEGFIQGIKFPLKDPRRETAFKLAGMGAKKIGIQAENKYVWLDLMGKLSYGSKEHYEIIEMAIKAKFQQNPDAMQALLSTGEKKITHEVGPESPQTSLPKKLFCEILTEIREENRGDRERCASCTHIIKGGTKENGRKKNDYYRIAALVCGKCYGLTEAKDGATALPKCDHCGRQLVTAWAC